jgi:hypothetical protein
MDRLTTRLRSLADDDAAATDPSPAAVDRGWTRLCAALAAPIAVPIGAVATKTLAGVLAIVVLGVSAAAAPTVIDREVTAVEPTTAPTPRALAPASPPAAPAFASAPPPARPPVPLPATPVMSLRHAAAGPGGHATAGLVDPLVAELRALAAARGHLDAGRFRQALGVARKLLRSGSGQLQPEARAIEAVAACALDLPRAPALASAYHQQHASSPHRKRVAAACEQEHAGLHHVHREKTRPAHLP